MSGSRWGVRQPRERRPERWIDPIPPRGYTERVYCTLRARMGKWPADFLGIVERAYRGKIPPRFLALVAKLERERPWLAELEELERELEATRGLPPTITVVDRDGRVIDRWRPTREEWEAAAP